MNWTVILARAGIPESPGYRETFDRMGTIKAAREQATLEERQAKARGRKPTAKG